MTDKILATFRLAPELWQAFQARAKDNRSNASRLLVEFVESYLGNPSARNNPIELEQRVARLESQLASLLSEVDARIEKAVGQQPVRAEALLQSQLIQLQQQLIRVQAEGDELREQLASAQAQLEKMSRQPASMLSLNYEAIARKILDSLNLGVQSAGYKAAVKALSQFVAELKGATISHSGGQTASKLVSDAVVAHGMRFDILSEVARKIGYTLDLCNGSYRVKKERAVLFETGELTALAAWLRKQPLPKS